MAPPVSLACSFCPTRSETHDVATVIEPSFRPYPIPGFQDPFSSFSHLFAAPIFLILGIMLIQRGAGHFWRMFALGLFVFGVIFQMLMSGVYHLLPLGTAGREILRVLDHAAIFCLIAATFTPIHALLFRGWWRWGILIPVWVLAIIAITLKCVYFNSIPESLSLSFYLGLGWVGGFSAVGLVNRYGLHSIRWLVAGAGAYTIGAIAEFARQPTLIPGIIGPHEFFHVMVLIGLCCHGYMIWQIADGRLPPLRKAGQIKTDTLLAANQELGLDHESDHARTS